MIDPQTGEYSTDVSFQPTGAMGAVTSLLNAQKAQQIADTLQQQRQAQASMESQQAEQYGLLSQRQQAVRDAVSQHLQQYPNASMDEIRNVAIGAGSDIAPWTSTWRSEIAASGKATTAQITGATRLASVAMAKGLPMDQVANIVTGALPGDPDAQAQVLEQMKSAPGANQPLPLPAAQGANLSAGAGLKTAETGVVASNAKAKQDLEEALARLARARAAVAGKSQLTDQETKNLYSYLKTIETVRARYATDKTAFMDPGIAAQIGQLDKEIAETKQKIQAKSVAGNYGAGATIDPTRSNSTSPSDTPPGMGTSKTLVFPP